MIAVTSCDNLALGHGYQAIIMKKSVTFKHILLDIQYYIVVTIYFCLRCYCSTNKAFFSFFKYSESMNMLTCIYLKQDHY